MPVSYFYCFAKYKFVLVGGVWESTCVPNACWAALGHNAGIVFDNTWIREWQQSPPQAGGQDAYLVQIWNLGNTPIFTTAPSYYTYNYTPGTCP